ncbi:hypothetical protein J2W40_002647 [Sphingobium xenophagum]|uniref:DUF4145 domain-containing protein n=1 Tax=Sphingobium xenophagum TaxID=121428 RepID=A0ABU1X2L9_SPHXE|nr:hypothetical protein [Sphingobium xenophagum]MDR7155811.1 hypothetical protein [Sphingobium xenophagum]
MTFKKPDQLLTADPRFATLVVSDERGVRAVDLAEHHRAIANVNLLNVVPPEVRTVFDRARNTLLYAYFAYDLLVVGEAQAFAAFELALKYRLAGNSVKGKETLRNLVDRARKAGILPPADVASGAWMDPIEAIIHMRNVLAHGTSEIHSPGMALDMLEACARKIDQLFPPSTP